MLTLGIMRLACLAGPLKTTRPLEMRHGPGHIGREKGGPKGKGFPRRVLATRC